MFLTIALFFILNLSLRGYPDKKIIIAICAIAIAARFILAISNYYFSFYRGIGADLVGDARAYSASGQYIAEVATNRPMPNLDNNEPAWVVSLRNMYKGVIPSVGYRVDNFAKYVGLIYSVFGYNPITVKLINSLLSVFTGVLLFFLMKDMFSVGAAKIVLVLTIFCPSIFLWSITGTKDSLTIFLMTLWLFSFFKLRKHVDILEFSLAIAMLFVQNYVISALFFIGIFFIRILKRYVFKRKILYPMIIPLVLILVMKIASDGLRLVRLHIFLPLLIASSVTFFSFLNKKMLIFSLIIILCLGVFVPFYLSKYNVDINRQFISFTENALRIQRDQLKGANSGYKIYPDRFYGIDYLEHPHENISRGGFIISYFKGIFYTIFMPFPWLINNKESALITFQMLLYYMLIPFIFSGIFIALRYRWRNVLSILIFMIIIVSMYGIYEGNIGTLFRHRDILMVLFIIFGAIGISKTLNILVLNGHVEKTN